MTNTMNVRRSSGFTIVEVLVALVVLSVGMLGIAGLYVTTLRASGSALYRTQAVSLATDMADRIRANPLGGDSYSGAGANRNCVAGGVDCSAQQMAEDDVFRWRQQLTVLPGANGAVARVAGPPQAYTITVSWTEPGGEVVSYNLRMQI
jgi:type IV pilus assembly protein PilV